MREGSRAASFAVPEAGAEGSRPQRPTKQRAHWMERGLLSHTVHLQCPTSKSLQKEPTTREQMFKCLRLWGTFLVQIMTLWIMVGDLGQEEMKQQFILPDSQKAEEAGGTVALSSLSPFIQHPCPTEMIWFLLQSTGLSTIILKQTNKQKTTPALNFAKNDQNQG